MTMENKKDVDVIQKEILKLLDGLTYSSAKTILLRIVGELEHEAIISVPKK